MTLLLIIVIVLLVLSAGGGAWGQSKWGGYSYGPAGLLTIVLNVVLIMYFLNRV
jgi:hypothetical protein